MKTVHDVLKGKEPEGQEGTIYSIAPNDSVFHAIESMAHRGVGALLVMQEEQLIGIISERDYARKVILKGKSSKQTPVSTIMTTQVVTVPLIETVDACMRLMRQHHIRHLPVVNKKQVIGMVSLRDLMSVTIAEQASTINQLEHYIRGEVG
ncbi:MAG: CBS domain-containing protein [Proteobacteria bacterium]|nr:CBS domain-containing protein [Pseudomonadota bacterium]